MHLFPDPPLLGRILFCVLFAKLLTAPCRFARFRPTSAASQLSLQMTKDLHAAIRRGSPETEEELIEAAKAAWREDITYEMINKHILHFTNAVKKI